MKLRVLGCSGGIGGGLQTTSLLLDHDVLVDAGTGLTNLSCQEMAAIDHVFLTHAHLDHFAALPLMIDSVGQQRAYPIAIYGIESVIDSLKRHVFNGVVWPDFSQLPSSGRPFLEYKTILEGEMILVGAKRIVALPVGHSVPAVGYWLDSGVGSLVFSGDTGPSNAFWTAVNEIPNLKHLIVECAFPNREAVLASMSKHLHPELLAIELAKLCSTCEIHVTHLKPGYVELTMAEINQSLGHLKIGMLYPGQVVEF
jgi:ribonuclease BN (tRNA processing enzyme)